MSEEELYRAALCAAFWVALLRFRATPGPARHAGRFVIGMTLGAAAARPGGLLCLPLGLLLAAPRLPAARAAFLEAALPCLPLAFAVAKLGCLAAGCCGVPLVEALGFAAVAFGLVRVRPDRAAPAALAGIGAVRLAVLPLRPGAELSGVLAVVWLLWAALRCPPVHQEEACRRPGSATSSRTAGSSRPGCAGGSAALATSR